MVGKGDCVRLFAACKGCRHSLAPFHMTKQEFTERLSPHLYWDVDANDVDVDRHQRFIIPRIMDRGTLLDVRSAWDYYGEECVRDALLNARSLDRKTISFFTNQFNLSRDRFRAFREARGTWDR